jgi:hypothetical protein
MLVVMLLLRELYALCSSLCCDVEYNVIITFLHTHKKNEGCVYQLYIIGVVPEWVLTISQVSIISYLVRM